jgi:serine/threonine-protein kinase RsbW
MKESIKTLVLSSNAQNVVQVENFVQKLAKQLRLAPDTQSNIFISLTEAVANAIIHGNRQDERKIVEVRSIHAPDSGKLTISIKDEGAGFDPANIPDPTSPENICNCGGRGVYLMRQLSDEVNFKKNPNVVEMHFKY